MPPKRKKDKSPVRRKKLRVELGPSIPDVGPGTSDSEPDVGPGDSGGRSGGSGNSGGETGGRSGGTGDLSDGRGCELSGGEETREISLRSSRRNPVRASRLTPRSPEGPQK